MLLPKLITLIGFHVPVLFQPKKGFAILKFIAISKMRQYTVILNVSHITTARY